ncbi:MAG: hypothetical protein ACREV6_09605 [Clostridium sp.]|uniref:hypothetical protein n=1 Tax=Clostridium sp. TaxID=1506 RepID=UPI003D6C78B5
MRKNKFKGFSFLLALFLLIGVNSTIAEAKTAKYNIPAGYNAACITTKLSAPRFGQTIEYMYLPAPAARKFARAIKGSNTSTGAQLIAGLFLPQPYGGIWSVSTAFNAMKNGSIGNNIEDLSEKGPVEIRLIKDNYSTNVASFPWNGKNISLSLRDTSAYVNESVVRITYLKR